MTPRQKRRLTTVLLIIFGVGLAASLTLNALQQNLLFFLTPTQVLNGDIEQGKPFRLGGLVEDNSITRLQGTRTRFGVTDTSNTLVVEYEGILPDLFREGQGVVVKGKLGADGVLVAAEVLAKHDENYIPLEVKDALDAQKTLQPEPTK